MSKRVIINDLHRSLHPLLQSQHDILSGVSVILSCQYVKELLLLCNRSQSRLMYIQKAIAAITTATQGPQAMTITVAIHPSIINPKIIPSITLIASIIFNKNVGRAHHFSSHGH